VPNIPKYVNTLWMKLLFSYRRFWLSLLICWALLFLGHGWEEGLKMDAMENASIAKFVLKTGNWKSFRYEAEAYPQYYNHPPLVIWIEAIFFKLFGASDFVARIPPALFGLGTLIGVISWGSLVQSLELGLLSGLVLLTSNRYIKFASDALLEGPLCFFLVWGVVAFLSAIKGPKEKHLRFAILLGLCMTGAFLTKSVFALILPLTLGLTLLLNPVDTRKGIQIGLIACFVFSAMLGVWFYFGDGFVFLKNHYSAISSRVESRDWNTLAVPSQNLLKTYWPWLPFYILSLVNLGRYRNPTHQATLSAVFMSLIVLIGFSFSGHFFEHYLTLFYPAASIITSLSLSSLVKNRFRQVESWVWGLAIFSSVALATWPLVLHRNRAEPLATTLREMNAVCMGQKEIVVSQLAMDRWLAVAITLWKTPFEIISTSTLNVTPKSGQLLITRKDETPSKETWEKVPLCLSQFSLFQAKQFPLCRQN